jgi:hypothetical protein
MPDPREVFSDAMPEWQIVDSPSSGDSSDAVGKGRDRVAVEYPQLRHRYREILAEGNDQPTPRIASGEAASAEEAPEAAAAHAVFVRAKKKGADDGLVGGQTFLVSGSRIIGAQG